MAIILRRERPVLIIKSDSFEKAQEPWLELERCRPQIELAIRSVGRLESSDLTLPYLGTAFLAGNGLATTRHVAQTFADGPGDASIDKTGSSVD